MNNPFKFFEEEVVIQMRRLQNCTINYVFDSSDKMNMLFDNSVENMRYILYKHFLSDIKRNIEIQLAQGKSLDQIFDGFMNVQS